jgi:hypothetical protein
MLQIFLFVEIGCDVVRPAFAERIELFARLFAGFRVA